MKAFKRSVLAVFTAIVLSFLGAVPSNAATGHWLDGTNPVTTGCASGSYAIWGKNMYANAPYNTYQGYMEVRYSPRCGTNWIRVYNAYASDAIVWKTITRPAQGSLSAFSQTERDRGTGWSYGMQVYAPGATRISVAGLISTSPWVARASATLI